MKLQIGIVIAALTFGLTPSLVLADNTGVDTSFGPDSGHYRYDREPYSQTVTDAAIDSQGRILLAFYITDDSGAEFVYWPAVIRLMPDGSPDLSFGFLSIWMESSQEMTPECTLTIAVDSSDRPILGWTFEFTQGAFTNRDGWIRRLTSSGATDIGKVWAFDLGVISGASDDRLDQMTDIMVISGDRVVAVGQGQYNGADWDYIIGVYKPNAQGGLELDDSFSSDGRASVGFDLSGSSYFDSANAVTVDSTGNIVLVGTSHSSSGNLVSACRISSADGSLDTNFSVDGRGTFAYEPTMEPSQASRGVDVAALSSGFVIGAKLTPNSSDWKIGALKVGSDGDIDISFGDGLLGAMGWLYLDPTYPGQPWTDASTALSGIAIDNDRIVYSASIGDPLDSNQGGGILLVTDLSGNADTVFSGGGYDFYSFEPDGEQMSTVFSSVLIPGAGVTIDTVGKVVLVGSMRGVTSGGSRSDTDILATQVYTRGLIFSDGFETGGLTAWDSVGP